MSYEELNARANQLAHYLRARGVGPDVLVGICVERSPEMAVGLLGILEAGGAYVPLDPSYPQERLAFMLDDAQVPVLLTQQHLMGALPEHRATIVCLDADGRAIAQEPRENPQGGATAESLAYVIYTSGSTGRPKGVLIPHRGLVNHSMVVATPYGLRSDDRVLQFASMSVDIAVEELFPTWITGGAVIAYPHDPRASVTDFLEAIDRDRITVLNLPTAFWHELVHRLTLSKAPLPSTLRLVVVGGEKAAATAFARWQPLGGDRSRWVNSYGPTETTVTATIYEPVIDETTPHRMAEIPIGRPIANTQVYLLDRHLQPVPLGIPGELYIGGVGVARGYLNRPELTAERFIPHPFSDIPGARLYKTGDVARYRADGHLEFVGRLDHQVKIRGFRVELGEIEAALHQHSGVGEAIVVAREEVSGEKRLVAYVVPVHQPPPTDQELRSFLQSKLPRYLLPAVFVYRQALPRSPNGKVDRGALPPPDELIEARAALGPRDELERQLTQIWTEILRHLALLDAGSPGSDPPFLPKCRRLSGHLLQLDRQAKKVFLREKREWIKLIVRECLALGIWNPQARRLRQVKHTNVHACRAYIPQVYAGKLTRFRAQKEHAPAASDPQLGWGRLVTGGLDIHEIPGDHYTMFTSPHIHILAQQLDACLQARHGSISTHEPKLS